MLLLPTNYITDSNTFSARRCSNPSPSLFNKIEMSISHHLIQRTEKWLRARLYGSEVGAFVGLSEYDSPQNAINAKIQGILRYESGEDKELKGNHSDATRMFFAHGT